MKIEALADPDAVAGQATALIAEEARSSVADESVLACLLKPAPAPHPKLAGENQP